MRSMSRISAWNTDPSGFSRTRISTTRFSASRAPAGTFQQRSIWRLIASTSLIVSGWSARLRGVASGCGVSSGAGCLAACCFSFSTFFSTEAKSGSAGFGGGFGFTGGVGLGSAFATSGSGSGSGSGGATAGSGSGSGSGGGGGGGGAGAAAGFGGSGFGGSGSGGSGLGGSGGAGAGVGASSTLGGVVSSATVTTCTGIGCCTSGGLSSDGRPNMATSAIATCNKPERTAPLRMNSVLLRATGSGAAVRRPTPRVKPAEVIAPITSITRP
jgi:hypothetical protein